MIIADPFDPSQCMALTLKATAVDIDIVSLTTLSQNTGTSCEVNDSNRIVIVCENTPHKTFQACCSASINAFRSLLCSVNSSQEVKEVPKEDSVQVNQFSAKEMQKQPLASTTGTEGH